MSASVVPLPLLKKIVLEAPNPIPDERSAVQPTHEPSSPTADILAKPIDISPEAVVQPWQELHLPAPVEVEDNPEHVPLLQEAFVSVKNLPLAQFFTVNLHPEQGNIENDTPVAEYTTRPSEPLQPIQLSELLITPDTETEAAHQSPETDEVTHDAEPAQLLTSLLAERIDQLDEAEAEPAHANLQTMVILAEQLQQLDPETQPELSEALHEQLIQTCEALFEQLSIDYQPADIERFITRLVHEAANSHVSERAAEQPEENFWYTHMREISGGNPLGLLSSITQWLKDNVPSHLKLGRVALVSATASV